MVRKHLLLGLFLAALVLLVGCAGHGGHGSNGGSASFVGPYSGTASLDPSQGEISLVVAQDGGVNGVLAVGVSRAFPSGFPDGSYPFTGTVDSKGELQASGPVPPEGTFTVSGRLPRKGDAGTLAISYNGATYSATVERDSSSGATTLSFTNSGSNANLAAWSSGNSTHLILNGNDLELESVDDAGGATRTFTFYSPTGLQAGDEFTIDANGTSGVALGYKEEAGKTWFSSGGSIKVIAATATSLTIELRSVQMSPFPGTGSTGGFVVGGTMKG